MDTFVLVLTLGLCIVFALYFLFGIKRYQIVSSMKLLGKKEMAFSLLLYLILTFGMTISFAYGIVTFKEGKISELCNYLSVYLLNNNESVATVFFGIPIITLIVFVQSLIMSSLVELVKLPYMKAFYGLSLFVFNPALYMNAYISVGQHLFVLFASIWILFALRIIPKNNRKKDIFLSGIMLVILGMLGWLEQPTEFMNLLLYPLILVEGIMLAFYLDKAYLLRKKIKLFGVFCILIIFMILNYIIL